MSDGNWVTPIVRSVRREAGTEAEEAHTAGLDPALGEASSWGRTPGLYLCYLGPLTKAHPPPLNTLLPVLWLLDMPDIGP